MSKSKAFYIILAIILAAISIAYVSVRGDTYVISFDVSNRADEITTEDIDADGAGLIYEVTDTRIGDDKVEVEIRSIPGARGTGIISVDLGDYLNTNKVVYVHRYGIITADDYFGNCTGGIIIPICTLIYLVAVVIGLIRKYRADVRQEFYQYRNIRELGALIYLFALILGQIQYIIGYNGLIGLIHSVFNSASMFSGFALPVAFVLSIMVTVSNIKLIRSEGRNWRNMLGFLLGIALCFATVFPDVLSDYLQQAQWIDVHNQNAPWYYVELAVENLVMILVTYLECILLATVVFGYKAAHRIPAFDKTHILILGCAINSDGTLTKLLQGRADRAVEFAKMQKEATGKGIIFVPSGGQGSDEVISEAAAVRNYLNGIGIDDSRILMEDKSVNTHENFRNSAALINETCENPKIAFSTTNYHVFRSGLLAARQGIKAEGIGSRTRSYFWINAFIREFIATMVTERKAHIKTIAVLFAVMVLMIMTFYISNNPGILYR